MQSLMRRVVWTMGLGGLAVVLGMLLVDVVGVPTATAFNSHKLITLRGRGLASIVWTAGGGQGENLGSLFSTASYDTSAFPNARPEEERNLHGPIVCWTKLDELISLGGAVSGVFVSVFVQHAPLDLESYYTDFLYLSSSNRAARATGMSAGVPTLESNISVADSKGLAAETDGAFGRYLRARFQLSGTGGNRNVGVRASVECDVMGNSLIRN